MPEKVKPLLPATTTGRKRISSSIALGARPKAKQRRISSWVKKDEKVGEKEKEHDKGTRGVLTTAEVIGPSKPVFRRQQPPGSQPGEIKNGRRVFFSETQQTAKKIMQMLGEHKYKGKLQNAAAQYGLNIKDSLKMTPVPLQQVISIAAAMTS